VPQSLSPPSPPNQLQFSGTTSAGADVPPDGSAGWIPAIMSLGKWQDILTLKTSRCSAFPCMKWLHALSGFGSLAVIGVVLTQFRFEWKIGPVPPSALDDTVRALRRDFQRYGEIPALPTRRVEREIASRRWEFAKELAWTFLPFSCSPSTRNEERGTNCRCSGVALGRIRPVDGGI
jgi:hypothetical protein